MTTSTDEGFDLLPDATEPPDPATALSLEDTLVDPNQIATVQGPPVPLGRAPAIDFVQHKFVPSAAGGPLMVYGLDTLKQWVEKCLLTRRGENAACHPDFGLDSLLQDLIDGGPFDSGAVAEYEAIVERALTVHADIDSIDGWAVDYEAGDDAAVVSFSITRVTQGVDPLDIDVALPVSG